MVAIISLMLGLISGQWQVIFIVIGMGMFIESDHDRIHHPGRGMSHRYFQIGGGILAVFAALALRFPI